MRPNTLNSTITTTLHRLSRWLLVVLISACQPASENSRPVGLEIWAHAGQQAERTVLEAQIARFNGRHDDIRVSLTFLPEGAYNGQVQSAALAGELPDILEFDGPYLYNYAWAGKLRSLDELLPDELLADLLPSVTAQGRYRGKLFAVGTFDSGLGLYAHRGALADVGIRMPEAPQQAWTIEEFDTLLEALAQKDPDGAVLDLKLNYSGEWFSYGFAPIVQSAGGDLIDRRNYQTAQGVLNGAASVRALQRVQNWFNNGYVDANLDDAAFVTQRVALSWVGHWEYSRYHAALGEELMLVPLPDFGNGTRTGQGSWNWGITKRCANPRAAAKFLAFLLEPEEVLAMSGANGAVPATYRAIARSPRFATGGPLHLYVQQLTEGVAVPRPRTPAYPTISSAFAQAIDDIRHGTVVQTALDRAVTIIDQDLSDNHGYPVVATEGGWP